MTRWLQGSILTLCLLCTLPCCAAKKRMHRSEVAPQVISSAQALSINWESYTAAVNKAKDDGKPIGLFFTGSNWCIWCMKMHEQILSDPTFVKFANANLHLVDIDFPQPNNLPQEIKEQNQRLKSKYGVSGFPTLVFINSSGKELARMGFEYGGGINYVEKVKTSLNMKD
ncbi:thioredoxin-like domain protein [Chlamydia ibidis]|uniref:Thioredoxin-like domain protein n=2 Tax=Chlamydia ibidis TaxID=1405396 RepID=S7KJE0_9CHLA|nr:disulfide reductase DsbH [Chlamydia ibidis]EPP34545.1 thioredoxin-like domain protein [Chlamydia ibidis]EQM62318.1 putative thioredoxin disulfide isomerase [Chlamydia ibidis 10-1398/6]